MLNPDIEIYTDTHPVVFPALVCFHVAAFTGLCVHKMVTRGNDDDAEGGNFGYIHSGDAN